ncbi:MAG TPA: DeoR family transcriptional regulator, partial [Candidatus Paceibacterota bacterium]|nr:DeoR family transcriptional regulator [Candidatus Paceibacterota bacterium]
LSRVSLTHPLASDILWKSDLQVMNRNFFVRLAFAAHRVADALPADEKVTEEIRETANAILVDLLLLTDKEFVSGEQKKELLPRLERELDVLLIYLDTAEKGGWVKPENFALLKTEYTRIRDFLEIFEDFQETKAAVEPKKEPMHSVATAKAPVSQASRERVVRQTPGKQEGADLTERQQRIIDFLRTKHQAQVWELQKVLPQVTKRTLRRDLDELLQKNLVERKGEWNAVAYELK